MSNKTTYQYDVNVDKLVQGLSKAQKKQEETTTKFVTGTQKMGAGFAAAGQQAAVGTTMMANGNKQAANTLTNLNWLVSDSPYLFENMRMGIMSVSNNINPLLNNWTRMKEEFKTTKGVFKALGSQLTGPAGLATALTAVIAIVQVISIVMAKHKAKTEGATDANKEFAESLEQIQKETSIDSLSRRIDESAKYSKALDERSKMYEKNIIAISRFNELTRDNPNMATDVLFAGIIPEGADEATKKILTDYKKIYDEYQKLDKDKKKKSGGLVGYYEEQIKLIGKSKEEQADLLAYMELQQSILESAGIPSDKKLKLEEKLFEIQTARLPIEAQITAWEKKKAEVTGDSIDDKEKLLEYEQNIEKLNAKKAEIEEEIATLQNVQLSNDEKIAVLIAKQAGLNRAKLEDEKEYLALQNEIDKIQAASSKARDEAEKRYKQLRSGVDIESKQYLIDRISDIDVQLQAEELGAEKRKELETELFNFKSDLWNKEKEEKEELLRIEQQYQQNLAGIISQGGIEGIYEDMFSRIKEKVIQHWLDKLSITKAMMQMEEAITLLGEGKIQAFLDILFPKRIAQRQAEAQVAGQSAAIKSVDSASGIPFPGNIAAIGLVLASVFSSLRKAKVTGSQIVAAAEGAVINKPTLLLAGEALNRSGTEIVMPEKNFNRYMDEKILPGIMLKANMNNKGVESRLERVEQAIYKLGNTLPGATGKAVTRGLRGKF